MRKRFLAACRWLTWSAWEFGRGISIDQDGDVDGSGWMLRIEPPQWLRAWARRQLPPPTEDEMRFRRADISDVLVASLLRGVPFPTVMQGDFHAAMPSVTWAEDALQ